MRGQQRANNTLTTLHILLLLKRTKLDENLLENPYSNQEIQLLPTGRKNNQAAGGLKKR